MVDYRAGAEAGAGILILNNPAAGSKWNLSTTLSQSIPLALLEFY